MLLDKFDVVVHRTTIGRTLKSIGFQWLPIGIANRTYSSYRRKAIRDYLINLDVHLKHQATRRDKSVFVFTDESYCNTSHSSQKSYQTNDMISDTNLSQKTSNKNLCYSSGKGRRLVILHAMTVDGPLVQYDDLTKLPIDDLIWVGDTCHPNSRDDKKLLVRPFGWLKATQGIIMTT